jgi:ankyrin repeat protein
MLRQRDPSNAQLLLDLGAFVDPRDSHGNTPLGTAVFNSKGRGVLENASLNTSPVKKP